MTEEIIIDGVNVAGCEFCKPNPLYKIEYACHCRGCVQDDGLHVHLSCEHNPNCYYKQLKRLEQERDELKRNNKRMKAILEGCGLEENGDCTYCNVDKAYHELKQENKELEEKFNAFIEHSKTESDKVYYKMLDYKTALEEIREIEKLAYYSKGMPEEPLSQRDFILDAINNYEQRRIKILTKINEVLQ